MDFEYCEAWPEELKEAERQRYRASCRVRCLEACLDRIDPSQFDRVMGELEQALKEVFAAGALVLRLKSRLRCAGRYSGESILRP